MRKSMLIAFVEELGHQYEHLLEGGLSVITERLYTNVKQDVKKKICGKEQKNMEGARTISR